MPPHDSEGTNGSTLRSVGRSVVWACARGMRRERDMSGRPYTSNVPVPLRLEPGSLDRSRFEYPIGPLDSGVLESMSL